MNETRKFKPGDRVRLIGKPSSRTRCIWSSGADKYIGQVLVVSEEGGDGYCRAGGVHVEDDDGNYILHLPEEAFELVTDKRRPQKGDRLRLKDVSSLWSSQKSYVGQVGVMVDNLSMCPRIQFSDGKELHCTFPEELEFVDRGTLSQILRSSNDDNHINESQAQERETTMSEMTKHYRLLKDTPEFEAGAIFKQRSGYSEYMPIEPIWDTDAQAGRRKEGGTTVFSGAVVENSPEWFEEIYETSRLGKTVWQTKEAAKAEFAALFNTKKK